MIHLADNFDDIVRTLQDGGCILYPTDTVWGIGCSSLNESAIKKIYTIKQRDLSKPFILLVSDIKMLKSYIKRIHPRIETLLEYYDRPITIIYKGVQNLPELAYSRQGTVAIRITKDAFCREIIDRLTAPLVSTSANLSGEKVPAHFDEINPAILKEMDYIVRYRQNEKTGGETSIMVRYDEEGELYFIRS